MLDTNLLLQCRDLPELPWAEVTDAREVELYPAPTALHEVDKFKTSGDRRSDRARKVSTRLRQVVLDPDEQLELRPHSPRLVLRMPPPLPEAEEAKVAQQPSNDYRIVEEAIALASTLEGLCLLTADTGPSVRAKQRGFPFKLVHEGWLLPPVPDPRDRRIVVLEQQVAALSNGGPVIEAQLAVVGRADIMALPITEYGQLSPFTRDQLLEVVTGETLIDAEQRLRDRLRGRDDNIVVISVYAPEDYLADVKAWREEVRKALEFASPHAQIASRLHPFSLTIANTGARPAEHIKVAIEASGYVILASRAASARYWDADEDYLADARLGAPRLELPAPPPSGGDNEDDVDVASPPLASGRYDFRRTSRDREDEAEDAIVFECEDLRHGGESHTLYFAAFLGGAAHDGELKVTITAANLPDPVRSVTPVKCIESGGDIDGVVTNMVKLFKTGVRLNRRRAS